MGRPRVVPDEQGSSASGLPGHSHDHHADMADDDDDRVIRFPGSQPAPAAPPAAKGKAKRSEPTATERPPDPADLDEDRRKAISVILSGMPFVCIGIQPSPTGADFFTSLGGDTAELAKAQPHLDGVIDRLFQKRGIR